MSWMRTKQSNLYYMFHNEWRWSHSTFFIYSTHTSTRGFNHVVCVNVIILCVYTQVKMARAHANVIVVIHRYFGTFVFLPCPLPYHTHTPHTPDFFVRLLPLSSSQSRLNSVQYWNFLAETRSWPDQMTDPNEGFYYCTNGNTVGPVNWQELCKLGAQDPRLLVWRQDFTNWVHFAIYLFSIWETTWLIWETILSIDRKRTMVH